MERLEQVGASQGEPGIVVSRNGSRATRRMRRRLGVGLLALTTLAGPVALTSCAVNPATGARQFSLFSEAQEIEMGREYDPQIVAQMGLYPDEALQRYIQELGTRLAAQSERPNLPWTFRVLDDPVVNAFALPGGYIYITRGILAHLGSEAELAGVLGHEIGHVTARHSVGRMSTQQLAQLGLAIGAALRPDLEGLAGVAGVGLQVAFLKYGRDDERQADDLGVRYMLRGNYDPREMPQVFDMLDRVTQDAGGGGTPEWLSTHPNPGNRRERIAAQVAAHQGDLTATVAGRDSYLKRLDGMTYGENPREGFFRANKFFHPDLAFRHDFPEGWQTDNQKNAVLAVSPNQDAMIQITLAEGRDPEAAARAFLGQEGFAAGALSNTRINELPATVGDFSAATQQGGRLRGRATFIAHNNAVYQLLAYSAEPNWASYDAVLRTSVASFARLTDAADLAVEPLRLKMITIDREMTIAEFARRYLAPVPVEKIALINHADPDTRFERGTVLKTVVGQVAR
jgi:predicted Zn-dependent protease